MAYVDLDIAKKHLNIDESFTEDDEYITVLIDSATEAVSQDVCEKLEDLKGEDGRIPSPLHHAILLLVGDFYANREVHSYGSAVREFPTYKNLIRLYRNYEK